MNISRQINRLGPIWILVAHESGARIFNRWNQQADLELIEVIDHPIGRAKSRELVSDKPGSEEDWGSSASKHGFGQKTLPTEKNALDFARELAQKLEKARDLNQYDYLVLVAGPKFLGMLRQVMSSQTSERVVATLDQNLGNSGDREIPRHINQLLADFDRTKGLRRAV